jgi:hypothetical protein
MQELEVLAGHDPSYVLWLQALVSTTGRIINTEKLVEV